MATNIFQNSAKSIPTSDDQIVRVDMESLEIGGRKSHLPAQQKADKMAISHVPNKSSSPGGQ
jgi:hypothetical protein